MLVHNTALNSSDNLHSYPPDNHHSSDKMPRYRREYRAIAAVNFGATGIIGVAEV